MKKVNDTKETVVSEKESCESKMEGQNQEEKYGRNHQLEVVTGSA